MKAVYATDQLIQAVRDHNLKIYVWDCHADDVARRFFPINFLSRLVAEVYGAD